MSYRSAMVTDEEIAAQAAGELAERRRNALVTAIRAWSTTPSMPDDWRAERRRILAEYTQEEMFDALNALVTDVPSGEFLAGLQALRKASP